MQAIPRTPGRTFDFLGSQILWGNPEIDAAGTDPPSLPERSFT